MIVLGLIVLFLAVILVRAAMFRPKAQPPISQEPVEFDKDAAVKKLIVGHYSSRFPSVDFFLDEIQTIFPDVTLAHDGDVIEL